MEQGQPVLVDTNIIIEAVRTSCWNALRTHFKLDTVEKCCEEARSGHLHRPGYVEIQERVLREKLNTYSVTEIELINLSLKHAKAAGLDEGERHLWAHALTRSDAWMATTADKAAFFAACHLGWRNRMVSLEVLIESAGARHALKQIRPQFTKARLDQWGSEFALSM